MTPRNSTITPAVRTVRFTQLGLRSHSHGLGELHFTEDDLPEMGPRIAAHVAEHLSHPVDTSTLNVVVSPDHASGHVTQRLLADEGPLLKVAAFNVIDSRKEAQAQRKIQRRWAAYVFYVCFLIAVGTYIGWTLGQGAGALLGFLLAALNAMVFPKPRR